MLKFETVSISLSVTLQLPFRLELVNQWRPRSSVTNSVASLLLLLPSPQRKSATAADRGAQIILENIGVVPVRIIVRGFRSVSEGTTDQWLVGQILDAKSNVCPTPVQSPSNVRPKKGRVEGLSKHCPGTVRALSNLCQVPKHLDRDWTGKSRDCREPVHRS